MAPTVDQEIFIRLLRQTEYYPISVSSKRIVGLIAAAYVEPDISDEKREQIDRCIRNHILRAYADGVEENSDRWESLLALMNSLLAGVVLDAVEYTEQIP